MPLQPLTLLALQAGGGGGGMLGSLPPGDLCSSQASHLQGGLEAEEARAAHSQASSKLLLARGGEQQLLRGCAAWPKWQRSGCPHTGFQQAVASPGLLLSTASTMLHRGVEGGLAPGCAAVCWRSKGRCSFFLGSHQCRGAAGMPRLPAGELRSQPPLCPEGSGGWRSFLAPRWQPHAQQPRGSNWRRQALGLPRGSR